MIRFLLVLLFPVFVSAQSGQTDEETIESFYQAFFHAVKYMDDERFQELFITQEEFREVIERTNLSAEDKKNIQMEFAQVLINGEQHRLMLDDFKQMQKKINKKELRAGLYADEYYWNEQDTGMPQLRIVQFQMALSNSGKKHQVSVEIVRHPDGWQILRAFDHDF